jgi:hypothetical protein
MPLFSSRIFGGVTLVLGLVFISAPLAQAADTRCDVLTISIGAVANNPFTADEVQGKWEILPDGSRKLVPLKEGEMVGPRGYPYLISRVARDSEGRIAVETPAFDSTKAIESGEPDAWLLGTICDPVAGTVTNALSHSIFLSSAKDPVTGKMVQTVTYGAGKAEVRPWKSRRSRDFGPCDCKFEEELGFEQVEGVSAHRVRMLGSSATDEVPRTEFWEQVLSEELAVQFSNMRVDTVAHIESGGIKLIHVKREEPDPDRLKIPENYTVVYPEGKPQESAPQPVAKTLGQRPNPRVKL